MSFLRKDGRVWTTDKDGLIPDLLAAEITAKTGKNPAQLHQEQVERFGESWYKRIDTPTTLEQKQKFAKLSGDDVAATTLAGEDITAKLTEAPGNNAKIGGLKAVSYTHLDVYKRQIRCFRIRGFDGFHDWFRLVIKLFMLVDAHEKIA